VAFEIAKALRAPLDVFLVRKLGVPGFEELALGAITMDGMRLVDPDMVEEFGLPNSEIAKVIATETRELERRKTLYRAGHRPIDVKGRTVILVDDGAATGSTMRAAIRAIRGMGCAQIVAAIGVAPLSTYLFLESEADEVLCVKTPRMFRSVGQFYERFPQVTDEEVLRLLKSPSARSAA
jgi:predicted phosphoribosyltransferase